MAKTDISIVVEAVDQATQVLGGVKKSINEMSPLSEQAGGAIDRLSDRFTNFGNVSKAEVAVAGAAIGGGIVAGVSSAINKFAEFESQMSGVRAVLNPTTEEMKALTNQAEELGAKTKFSALEAAQGTEMLARNGLNAQQILGGALEATLNLAAATGTDIATAADIATDAMASFGLQTENLGQVMNSITGVTNASKFAIEDYKYALAAGGGVAAALGVELEDFNTVIAATSSRFAGGSDAGTSFKTFMQRLVPASKEARGEMMNLGIVTYDVQKAFEWLDEHGWKPTSNTMEGVSEAFERMRKKTKMTKAELDDFESSLGLYSNGFYDVNGNLKSMAEISEILKEATKDLSEEQKNQALSTIFGSDALRTAMGLAEVGADKFSELSKAIEGTNAGENAKIRMDNLNGALEEMNGALDTVQIKIGQLFEPAIKLGARAIGFLADGVLAIINGLNSLPEPIGNAVKIFGGLTIGITALGAAAAVVAVTMGGLATAVGAILAPLLPIIGIIGAIGVALYGLYEAFNHNFLGIRDITNSVFGWMKDFVTGMLDTIKGVWSDHAGDIYKQVSSLWNTMKQIVTDSMKAIHDTFGPIFTAIQGFFTTHHGTITMITTGFLEGLKLKVKIAWDFIFNTIKAVLGMIEGVIKVVTGLITGNWRMVWDGIKTFTGAIWNWLWNTISSIGNRIRQYIQAVFGVDVVSIISGGWERVKSITSNIWNGVKSTIEGIVNTIKGILQSMVDKYNDAKAIVTAPIKFAGDVVKGAGEMAGNAGNAIKNAGSAIGSSVGNAWNNATSWFRRANGGTVEAGKTYIVNERSGNEYFIPGKSGTIVPEHKLGGGGANISINFGGVTINNEADENRLVEKIRQTLTKEMRTARLGII